MAEGSMNRKRSLWSFGGRGGATGALGAALAIMLLVFSACARPVQTTISSATATSSTRPATAATASPAPTSKPATASTPAASRRGPYGDMRVAIATFGQEQFELPVTSGAINLLTNVMFDFMVWTDKGELRPGLVEKWQAAPDGLSYTYSVRKGVKFHNGDGLTARDVKFSIEQFMRKDAVTGTTRDMVDHVDIIDDYTLRIFTRGMQPYLQIIQALASSPQQSQVMPKDYIEKNGWPYANARPVGSGPFKFVRHVPGDSVEYEAVDSHWRMAPWFKKLNIVQIPEEATRVAAVRTGAIDIAEVNLDSVPQLEAAGFRTPVIAQAGIGSYLYGAYDPRAAKMAIGDIRVRRALAISINRDEIIKSFFRGKGGPAMPIQMGEATLEIDVAYWKKYFGDMYRYDPEAARQLLKDAGYADGFRIKLFAYPISGATFLPQLSEVIAGYWQKVGIKAEVVPVDYGTWLSWRKPLNEQLLANHGFMRFTAGNSAPRGLESGFASTGPNPLLGAALPEVDKLIKAIYSEPDPMKRKELIAQAIKATHETYVGFQICSAPSLLAVAPGMDISSWSLPLASPYFTTWAADIKHKE